MSANMNFVSTRPNTDTEFWWVTTDPAVVAIRNPALEIAEQMQIATTMTISSDNLTCQFSCSVRNQEHWQEFVDAVRAAAPTSTVVRNAYHQNNGHTLKLEVRDKETGNLLIESSIVPSA